ncbi:MAG: imelysin family protein [Pseudomonadota bacterium]
MFRAFLIALLVILPHGMSRAQDIDIKAIVDDHILAGFATLEAATMDLEAAAQANCEAQDAPLRAAYSDAFDAWVRVSHLRFGPTERDDRGFALAFWPDSRGATPKGLSKLNAAEDPVVLSADDFATESVAVRGFYAMEFLLFDPQLSAMEPADYRCALVRAIATDMHRTATALNSDWRDNYASLLRQAGQNDTYRSETEALQELFKALSTGLQFTSESRLGRPLGTFDKPRPNRAEARRSGRSLRNVKLSLEGTKPLALALSEASPETAEALSAGYDQAFEAANALDDPVFASVSEPGGRFKVELVQQALERLRKVVSQELGPQLGVAAGFNALDGD